MVSVATEGRIDEAVARRLLSEAGHDVGDCYGGRGKGDLDARIERYCRAADHWPWLVLRDLDSDAPCPSDLVSRLAPEPGEFFHLRIAVPQVEAWLLADRGNLAGALSVAITRIPSVPESLLDAKTAMVELAQLSRSRDVRREMVPRSGSGAKVGPLYNSRMVEFVLTDWDPDAAAANAPSLLRAQHAIGAITYP